MLNHETLVIFPPGMEKDSTAHGFGGGAQDAIAGAGLDDGLQVVQPAVFGGPLP